MLTLLLTLLFFQAPGRPSGIAGTVIQQGTGKLLSRAVVVLQAEGAGRRVYNAVTSADGRFTIENIEPGRYRLSVTREGYVPAEFGADGPNGCGAPVTLEAGRRLTDMAITMLPAGAIAGRLLDQDGEAASNVAVQSLQYVYQGGRRVLTSVQSVQTNDLGEYRLFGLAPGRYLVAAALESGGGRQFLTLEGAAAGLILRTGAATPGAPAPAPPPAAPPSPAPERILIDRTPLSVFPAAPVTPGLRIVPLYYEKLFGRTQADVGDTDLQNLEIPLLAGIELSGRVSMDDPAALARIQSVTLRSLTESATIQSEGALSAPVTNGTFKLEGVPPGEYQAYVSFMAPTDIYIKSMRLGSTDVRNGFRLDGPPGAQLEIVAGNNGGTVDGVVVNDKGQPVRGAAVVLVPEVFLRQRSSSYKTSSTDASGAFRIPAIGPGDYKILAWGQVESGAWEDADFLRTYEARGQTLTLREGSRQTIQLSAIPSTGAVYGQCQPYLGPR